MKATYQWSDNHFRALTLNMKRIHNEEVKYGFFAETGSHPENPELNAPTLMGMHELRVAGDFNRRPVIQVALNTWGDQINRAAEKQLRIFVHKAARGRTVNANNALVEIGRIGCKITNDVFGDPNLLTPNTPATAARKGNRNTPMVEFGFLRQNLAYKTSITNKVIRG